MAPGSHQPGLSSHRGVRPRAQQNSLWVQEANPTCPLPLCPLVLPPPELGLANGGISSIQVLLGTQGLRKELAEPQQASFISPHIGSSDWSLLFPTSGSWRGGGILTSPIRLGLPVSSLRLETHHLTHQNGSSLPSPNRRENQTRHLFSIQGNGAYLLYLIWEILSLSSDLMGVLYRPQQAGAPCRRRQTWETLAPS